MIGVLEAVNKKDGVFTAEDEQTFQAFATFCGLIVHNSQLQKDAERAENQCKVKLYHITSSIMNLNG